MEKFSRRKKVYGKKTTPSYSATLFSQDITPPSAERTSSKRQTRRALDDLTTALANVKLESNNKNKDELRKPRDNLKTTQLAAESTKATPPRDDAQEHRSQTDRLNKKSKSFTTVKIASTYGDGHRTTSDNATQTKTPKSVRIPKLVAEEAELRTIRGFRQLKSAQDSREWLKPLTKAYEVEGRSQITVLKWKDILDPEWGVKKIAESSYAEVYKIKNENGTSVLKVMALKPPKGPGSQRETSVTVESVVSEVLIMDMMAEIPGFLEFKAAHIIEGKPTRAIAQAYEEHAGENGSEFPKPGAYHKEQLFLALELGDAGVDIEHFHIEHASQLWDIFLGTVFALANGETEFRFEHRDLHEGNVCVKQTSKPKSWDRDQLHKFGYSGLEVTLLDYTLSRAQDTNVLFRDLEEDFEIFNESEVLQHQMYRRMRIWAFFRSHGITHQLFDSPETPSHGSWAEFMPYTNVIWLYYLLEIIVAKYEGNGGLDDFLVETVELRTSIHPDKRLYDGGFGSAVEVLNYCVEQGWMNQEDLMD